MMNVLKNIILIFLLSVYFGVDVFAAPKLSLGAVVAGPSTPYVEIPLIFDNDTSNAAVLEFEISFDPAQVLPASIATLPILDGHDIDFEISAAGNTARIIIIPPSGNRPIPTGNIANIRFDLPSGNVAASQLLTTSINESYSDQAVNVTGFIIMNGMIVDANDSVSDADADGITDIYEAANGLHPLDMSDASLDADNDGLTNLAEFQLGTNIYNSDTDGDGLSDGFEVGFAFLSPIDAGDAILDFDGDGLSNILEFELGTNLDISNGIALPAGQVISGQILQDTVLLPDTSYEVSGEVDIIDGATLLVSPGASVAFQYNAKIIANGDLHILGSSSSRIIFSGLTTNLGYWVGIEVMATSNSVIHYADIQGAVTALAVNGASIEITNNSFTNFLTTGIQFASGAGGVIADNIVDNFNGNWSGTGIRLSDARPDVNGHNVTIERNLITRTTRAIYVAAKSDPVITENELYENRYGIYFRGANNALNDPKPVITNNSIYSNDTYNVFAISFANPPPVSLDLANNWWGTIDIPQIALSIYDQLDSRYAPTVDFVPFLDSENGLPIRGTAFPDTQAGMPLLADNSTYDLLGSLNIPIGDTLILPEGTLLRIHGKYSRIDVAGGLTVTGTSTNPVVITSADSSTANAWRGIYIASSGDLVMDYAVVEWAIVGVRFNNANGTIRHSIIQNNSEGIYIYQTSNPIITDANTITNNGYGIRLYGKNQLGMDPAPTITGNSIYNNNIYDLHTYWFYDPVNNVVDFSGNWWNSTDLTVINNKIYDYQDAAWYSPTVVIEPLLTQVP